MQHLRCGRNPVHQDVRALEVREFMQQEVAEFVAGKAWGQAVTCQEARTKASRNAETT